MNTRLNRTKTILENSIKEIKEVGISKQDEIIIIEIVNDLEKQVNVIDIILQNREINSIVIEDSLK